MMSTKNFANKKTTATDASPKTSSSLVKEPMQKEPLVSDTIIKEPIFKSMVKCKKVIEYSKHKIDIYWFKGTLDKQLCAYQKPNQLKYPSKMESPRVTSYVRYQGYEASKIQALVRSYQSRRRQERFQELQARIRTYKKAQYTHDKTRLLIFFNVKPCPQWMKYEKHTVEYNKMKYRDLRKLCRVRGLDSIGKKHELVSRLKMPRSRICPVCASVVIQGAYKRYKMGQWIKAGRKVIDAEAENNTNRNSHLLKKLRVKLDLMRASILYVENALRKLKEKYAKLEIRPSKEDYRKQSALKSYIRRRKKDRFKVDRILIVHMKLKAIEGHVLTAPALPESQFKNGATTLIQTQFRILQAKRECIRRRTRRAIRVRLRNVNRINILVAQRKKYWTRINAELAERRRGASTTIQCVWRSMKARVELQRRKEIRARRFLQRVWRGCIARHGIVWNKRKEREQNQFRHRVLFRLSNQTALWALNGWLAYVNQEQLWRQRLHLARQIAQAKWKMHCATRIQKSVKLFLEDRQRKLLPILKRLHPRLLILVEHFMNTLDWKTFVQLLLDDARVRQNPELKIIQDAERLNMYLPLIDLDLNDEFIRCAVDKWISWRPCPLGPVGTIIPTCFVYFIAEINEHYKDYDKLTMCACKIVQRCQEEGMIAQLTRLLLSDSLDWPHQRWDKLNSKACRSAMNLYSQKRDKAAFTYLRWFVDGEDLCGHCGALLSWDKCGKCTICKKHRYEMETSSEASRTKKYRLGTRDSNHGKRPVIFGLENVKEPVFDFLCHAAFCIHAPVGHWRRLMPKTQVWEESRNRIESIISHLNRCNIHTMGSLWLSILSGEFQTLPIERKLMKKIIILMKMLHVDIMTWVSTGEAPTGSIILEESNSDFLPNVPSILKVLPSLHGGRSRLSSRGTYRRQQKYINAPI
eukprot:g5335.t1